MTLPGAVSASLHPCRPMAPCGYLTFGACPVLGVAHVQALCMIRKALDCSGEGRSCIVLHVPG